MVNWKKLRRSLSLRFLAPSPPLPPALSLPPPHLPLPPSTDTTGGGNSSNAAVSRSLSVSSSTTTTANSCSRRFVPRSFTSRSRKSTCAICLASMKTGHGQAIFTAECSHSFHFSCIATSVKHGNRVCPICRSNWKDLPFEASADPQHGRGPRAAHVSPPPPYSVERILLPEPQTFSDDEPLSLVETLPTGASLAVSHPQIVTINAVPEYSALSSSESIPSFAVLVSLHAVRLLEDSPRLDRAPLDLVTVLDVSGSMAGNKIELLKRAVCFVVDNLGPEDRLSIVTFSSMARRIFPLRRMTDEGRQSAKAAATFLSAQGGTNIPLGLCKGIRVLEECREKNPMSSIVLLSDGRDNESSSFEWLSGWSTESGRIQRQSSISVHTFGIGEDHDSISLHAISDASRGTFSFIESAEVMQDGFARCIGGLLSVVAQQLDIRAKPASEDVHIERICSGRYCSNINDNGEGVITIGDMYADEKKEFLIYLSVPTTSAKSGAAMVKTPLLDITCKFQIPLSRETICSETVKVEIERPSILCPTDKKLSLEVDRQKNRFQVAEAIARAKELAEKRDISGAQSLLSEARSSLLLSPSGQAGDVLCSHLDEELREIQRRMANSELYENTGRAYVLSGMSSHSFQRATTRGDWTSTTQTFTSDVAYDTTSMVTMVSKSQNLKADVATATGRKIVSSTL